MFPVFVELSRLVDLAPQISLELCVKANTVVQQGCTWLIFKNMHW